MTVGELLSQSDKIIPSCGWCQDKGVVPYLRPLAASPQWLPCPACRSFDRERLELVPVHSE